MCLYIDHILTQQELAKDISSWIFYKIFIKYKNNSFLITPYHEFQIDGPGIVQILKPINKDISKRHEINEDVFHARITKKDTRQDVFYVEYFAKKEYSCICLPVTVKKENIVAFGIQNDVGICAYEITQDSWKNKEIVTLIDYE